MSFSFEFHCKTADAAAILEKEHAPAAVKDFILTALGRVSTDAVHIKAHGHLAQTATDYAVSTATLAVTPLVLRQRPLPPAEAAQA